MSHLGVYLDQISVSCEGIDSLPFPPPKVFTNALLYNDDITSLIRDTEAHERALFSVPPRGIVSDADADAAAATAKATATTTEAAASTAPKTRRQTVFNVAGGEVMAGLPSGRPSAAVPRRQTAVAAVLGGDLHAQLSGGTTRPTGANSSGGGDVDVQVLLQGAEKLCSVYALPGALERIPKLRQKHAQQTSTLAYYEAKVAEQAQRLTAMNRDWHKEQQRDAAGGENEAHEALSRPAASAAATSEPLPTEDDLRREEDEVRELERRKKELQGRLRAMDRDLGGLLHM